MPDIISNIPRVDGHLLSIFEDIVGWFSLHSAVSECKKKTPPYEHRFLSCLKKFNVGVRTKSKTFMDFSFR